MIPLRVGYTCHDAFPSTNTNTQQIFWTTSEVARLGHLVDIHVPALPDGDARASIARHYGAPGGVTPDGLRFVSGSHRGSGSTLGKAWFDLRAPWHFSRRTHDLVWTRDPLAFASALQCRVPAVFETYRPDYATSARFKPWRIATIGHSRRMRWVGEHRLAGVIAHSKLAHDAFVDAGVPSERVLVAHNGYAPSLMEPRLSRDEARDALGLSGDRPLVVYTGHVGPQKGTTALVALAAALPDIHLVIVGAGDEAERRWVAACGEQAGARSLTVVPRVHLAEVARYLYAADCLLIPPTGEPLTRYRRHCAADESVFVYGSRTSNPGAGAPRSRRSADARRNSGARASRRHAACRHGAAGPAARFAARRAPRGGRAGIVARLYVGGASPNDQQRASEVACLRAASARSVPAAETSSRERN